MGEGAKKQLALCVSSRICVTEPQWTAFRITCLFICTPTTVLVGVKENPRTAASSQWQDQHLGECRVTQYHLSAEPTADMCADVGKGIPGSTFIYRLFNAWCLQSTSEQRWTAIRNDWGLLFPYLNKFLIRLRCEKWLYSFESCLKRNLFMTYQIIGYWVEFRILKKGEKQRRSVGPAVWKGSVVCLGRFQKHHCLITSKKKKCPKLWSIQQERQKNGCDIVFAHYARVWHMYSTVLYRIKVEYAG